MSDNENNLPESVEGDDLRAMFKTAVPVQITITDPVDLLAILHSILRMMCSGDTVKANAFLKASADTAKVVGVDKAVAQGIQALIDTAGDKPPACLGPLLTHLLNHSLDPDNIKAFKKYLESKKKKGGKS